MHPGIIHRGRVERPGGEQKLHYRFHLMSAHFIEKLDSALMPHEAFPMLRRPLRQQVPEAWPIVR